MGSFAELCNARRMITGACLCGAVRYEAAGPLENLVHCHCSRCRKHHGVPFATLVAAPVQGFDWLQGEACVREYAPSEARLRRFCGSCSSVVAPP
jgi:hypothetical protein